MLYLIWFSLVAQTPTNNTADQARRLITEITTWKIAQAILILLLAYIFLNWIDHLILWISERVAKEQRLRVKQSLPFLRMLILGSAIIMLMNLLLNLSQKNVLAVTGTVAVALGFAFKDYVSSVIAGVLGLFEAPYRIGDRITIDNHYGEVITYGLRGLRLRTPSDNVVTLPHNKIWTEAISNANSGDLEAQVVTPFYLAHEADPQLVQNILYRVAYTSKYTQIKLPIVVILEEQTWGSLFKLKSYPIDARDEFLYKTDLTTRAKLAFRRHQLQYPRLANLD